MFFRLTSIIAIVAIVANAAPVSFDHGTTSASMAPNGVSLGSAPATTSTIPGTFDRNMTDTAVVNTAASCPIAFQSAKDTVVVSTDVDATLSGLIAQTKASTSLASLANMFKSLWPGYSKTIAPEFRPFAATLPPTNAVCKGQINVCLSSLLSTSKLVASSPSGAAAACLATK